MYPTLEGINEDPTLEIAQRVLQYPISNDGRSVQHYPGDIRSQDSGTLDRNIGQEVYQQDPREDHQPHEPVNNHTNQDSFASNNFFIIEHELLFRRFSITNTLLTNRSVNNKILKHF